MTDNEKAATFLGWKLPGYYSVWGDEPAPDMRRPENWSPALDSAPLCTLGRYPNGKWAVQWRDDVTYYFHWGDTQGQAVVAALASLYDKEHA